MMQQVLVTGMSVYTIIDASSSPYTSGPKPIHTLQILDVHMGLCFNIQFLCHILNSDLSSIPPRSRHSGAVYFGMTLISNHNNIIDTTKNFYIVTT